MNRVPRALTLLELLVAVGIVSILATVAVVNFLSAQVRAKVSRARADLAVVVTALEAYRVDHGAYPWHRGFGTAGHGEVEPVHTLNGYGDPRAHGFRTLPLRLSTPVAYLTAAALADPFKRGAADPDGMAYRGSGDPTDAAYIYHNIYQFAILQMSIDFFPDDFTDDYGHWRLVSLGPSGLYGGFGIADLGWLYDPTNGVRSRGQIIRTHIEIEGMRLAVPN